MVRRTIILIKHTTQFCKTPPWWIRISRHIKTGGGVAVDNQYGMTTVDLNNIGYKDEPFVLAKDVNQVFYVNDMSTKPKRKEKR